MVQKEMRARGRPKSYDREEAMMAALQTFWRAGYAGTSLDDLAQAMGMNRPSIYAAFGDKKGLYLTVMEFYRQRTKTNFDKAFEEGLPLCDTLKKVTANAIGRYVAEEKGCFVIGTAVTQAGVDADVQALTARLFHETEVAFTERFEEAAAQGVNLTAPPAVLGFMMADIIHGCSLRARAGVAREEIEAGAMRSIDMICGKG